MDYTTKAAVSTATGCGRYYVDSIMATGTDDAGDAQQIVALCTAGWVTAEATPGTWTFSVQMLDSQGALVTSDPKPEMVMKMMTSRKSDHRGRPADAVVVNLSAAVTLWAGVRRASALRLARCRTYRPGDGRDHRVPPITAGLTSTIRALLIANAVLFGAFILVRPLRTAMITHLAVGPGLFAGEIAADHGAVRPFRDLVVHLHHDRDLVGWRLVRADAGDAPVRGLYLTAGVLANVAFGLVAHLGYARSVRRGIAGRAGAVRGVRSDLRQGADADCRGLTLQARTIAMIYVAWSVVVCLSGSETAVPELAATAVATAVGYFGAAPGGFDALRDALKVRRLRRRYRVIDGGAGARPRTT